MLSFTTLTTALLATAGLINVASAVTEARLLPGVCGSLPHSIYIVDTGTTMVGELYIYAVGTGTYIDGLEPRWGVTVTQPRGAPAFETLGIYNNTGYAAYRIGCYDHTGIGSFLGSTRPYRINTERGNTLEAGSGAGLMLEPYAYYVDGERQPGVYLGAAGQVRWAWSKGNTPNDNLLWMPRLMVVTDSDPKADELREGEVAGFVVAKET